MSAHIEMQQDSNEHVVFVESKHWSSDSDVRDGRARKLLFRFLPHADHEILMDVNELFVKDLLHCSLLLPRLLDHSLVDLLSQERLGSIFFYEAIRSTFV